MNTVFDFHSHVLPGIDDGSQSVKEAIAMLRMEAEQGIRHVVATPHFYPRHDSPERFLERRAKAEQKLREEMSKYGDLPELTVGAEVYYFNRMSNSEALSQLTIDQKQCILIEMPPAPWTETMYRELEDLYVKRGLTPIVAHIDRYIGPFRKFGIPQRLAELPVIVQANADFFLKRSTASMALKMLKNNQIQLLGTDCHNLDSRKPNLGKAVQYIGKKLGDHALRRICECESKLMNMQSISF